MTRVCQLCGRGANIARRRSHSNIITRTKQKVNLQYHQVSGRRLRICSGCWKKERNAIIKKGN